MPLVLALLLKESSGDTIVSYIVWAILKTSITYNDNDLRFLMTWVQYSQIEGINYNSITRVLDTVLYYFNLSENSHRNLLDHSHP